MTAQLKKKMTKEIRAATAKPAARPTSDDIRATDLLSRYPKKEQKKGAPILASLEKAIEIKKKKSASKQSKRTTPGTVRAESPPKSPHVEGKRWIKTLQKQTNIRTKTAAKHQLKKK